MQKKTSLIFIIAVLIIFFSTQNTFPQDFWEPTNGPFGGNIESIVINANGHLFAGASKAFSAQQNMAQAG